ncbi:MAG: LacI family DNA-binding transcriptional regulator [Xanthomonadales bacterium]|nr:LacI family DNA-binding transcriptional regulator [Xanthomonadales bacterium]
MDEVLRHEARATIDDVATRAGVSIKTVSRVVNNEPNVREATRERVQAAIRELNYRPNASARRLAGNRSFLFALVYDDPSAYYNASANYATNLHGGALKMARASGYDLLVHPCEYRSPSLVEEIRQLVDHTRVDGLILVPPLAEIEPVISALREMEKPFIRVSPGEVKGFDAVHTNDREVCAEMVRYLASLGHERIGFIKGHKHHRALANREKGYRDGLKEAGLTFRKSLVMDGDSSFDSGVACGARLLSRKYRPTAIFAVNDDMAAGVLHAALDMGIGVPSEVSVAGFDDVPLSRQVWPTLTTIHQPVYEMAEKAAELLFRQIAGERLTERSVLKSRLVIRDSTGPAPSSD